MEKNPSVTIGIPAYNEEANIADLLRSLLLQDTKGYTLSKIIVITDGSTDGTVAEVKKLQSESAAINLIANKDRKGKYFRVNQLFHLCETDILVVFDADVIPNGNKCVSEIVKVFKKNKNAQMVAGHNILLTPNTFIGKIIKANFSFWDEIRLSMPNYHSGANYFGTLTGYRGSFVRSFSIPSDLTDPHLFIFLMAEYQKNGFRYSRDAQVLQWPLSTISDFKKLYKRSIGKRDNRLEEIFGINTENIYSFPLRYKLQGAIKAFFKQPFYTPLALFLGWYIAKSVQEEEGNTSAVWDITTSSKKPILPSTTSL